MITIAGAGVAGLACALELAKRGRSVTIYETGNGPSDNKCSWFAGGMLAPYCEGESAEDVVVQLGMGAVDWWDDITPVNRSGSLVVAQPRDRADLSRFARRTTKHQLINADQLAELEPALTGRFTNGLFFKDEAHLNPRRALIDLTDRVLALGVDIRYGTPAPDHVDVDCRGLAADQPDMRPVRGEMAILYAPDVTITRTVRLLHPRIPLYLVPRAGGQYMVGATMIESDRTGAITVRSLLELLGAAFALHPGLGEAEVIETGVGLRPAYRDNIPRVTRHGDTFHVNGLYRHGFLLAPALAAQLAAHFIQENADEHHSERCSA